MLKSTYNKNTHLVHGQVVADAVLPTCGAVLGLVRVQGEPLVNLAQSHLVVRLAHESAVENLGIGLLDLAAANLAVQTAAVGRILRRAGHAAAAAADVDAVVAVDHGAVVVQLLLAAVAVGDDG